MPFRFLLIETSATGDVRAVSVPPVMADNIDEARRTFCERRQMRTRRLVVSALDYELGLPTPLARDRCLGCGNEGRVPGYQHGAKCLRALNLASEKQIRRGGRYVPVEGGE